VRTRLATSLATIAIAAVGAVATAEAPAFAAGSTINIGTTIISGSYVKGSGSDYNTGDYTNVCVVIMGKSDAPLTSFKSLSQACRSNLGHNWWSAPDLRIGYPGLGHCNTYYTRITAYRNGTQVANGNKNSNSVYNCG
jgi:hypothetical protein